MLNPAEVILWNSHKRYLLELADRGVAVVPTTLLRQSDGLRGVARSMYGGDVVIKPAVSVGADNTSHVHLSDRGAPEQLGKLMARGDVLIQPYLPEIATGEVSLIYFGGEFSHAVRKTPVAGDFRVQVRYGGANTSHQPSAAERAVGDAAVMAVDQPTAYARADLVTTADGPLLMELELIEPQLFLDFDPRAPDRYANVLVATLVSL
jgi:glutathione synthase/RimK-type ligase-like ATP-grasp enzyme